MEKEIFEFKSKYYIEITSFETDVAAFIKTKDIIDKISLLNKNYDFIIVPGNFVGNCKIIEKILMEKNIKTRVIRGTRNLGDVKILLKNLESLNNEEIEKLHDFPADEILMEKIRENLKDELKELDNEENCKFKIRNLVLNGIPKIVGEISNAPLLDDEKIKERTKKFIENGAKIISIGMITEERADEIKRIVKNIKTITDFPICIDSLNENEILEGIRNGVDMVMSICEGNLKIVEEINVPVVVIPGDEKFKIKVHNERINSLENLIKKIKNLNENIKIIADPVLDPVNFGFTDSLIVYYNFRKLYPNVAMFMGVGNVTELVDVDSHGINALLAFIAYELNIDLLYTPEHSVKARNSTKELNKAIEMMFLAKKRHTNLTNLGIDMLVLKDKKREDINFLENFKGKFIDLKNFSSNRGYDKIHFKIFINNNNIYAIMSDGNKEEVCFVGNKSDEIYKGIIEYLDKNNLKISKEHCCYLGRELCKAEIALKLEKKYVQDQEIFKKI